MSEGVIVVKLGGSTLGAQDTSLRDCVALHRDGRAVVIVHGGGATVSDWLRSSTIHCGPSPRTCKKARTFLVSFSASDALRSVTTAIFSKASS